MLTSFESVVTRDVEGVGPVEDILVAVC